MYVNVVTNRLDCDWMTCVDRGEGSDVSRKRNERAEWEFSGCVCVKLSEIVVFYQLDNLQDDKKSKTASNRGLLHRKR